MTENEAKRFLEIEKECINRNCDRNCAQCDIVQKIEDLNSAYDAAIKALEEVQLYRAYKEKFKATYGDCDNALEVILDLILKYEFEQMKGSYILRLLTDEDAKKWDEYKQIGTPEECRAAVEKQTPKRPDYEGDGYADGQLVYDTWICPGCGKRYEVGYDEYDYCPNCGQKFDWENEG